MVNVVDLGVVEEVGIGIAGDEPGNGFSFTNRLVVVPDGGVVLCDMSVLVVLCGVDEF